MFKLKEKSNENKLTTTTKKQCTDNAGEDLEHVNICAFVVGMQN